MKKLVISIAIALTLIACSKEEVEQEKTISQTSIIGKWHTVSAQMNGKNIALSSCDLYGYIEFWADANCVIENGDFSGGKCNHYTSNGKYVFANNILTYTFGEYESRSKITDLTDSGFKSTTYYIKEKGNIENILENEQITYTVEKYKL